jgi:hypothetical protein
VTYYHGVVAESASGSLTESIPVGSTIYLIMNLSISGLDTKANDVNFFSLSVQNSAYDQVRISIYSDGIIIGIIAEDGESGEYYNSTAISLVGSENISLKFNSSNNALDLSVNDVSLFSTTIESGAWVNALTGYTFDMVNVTGSFEGWITDSPLAPESTPTPTTTPTATPTPGTTPASIDVGFMRVQLYNYDFFGFLIAGFLTAFRSLDILAGVITMLFLTPLYIKTKSLPLICIIWILLGSFFIAAMQIVSGMAVLFIALGIAGLLYQLLKGHY